MAQEETKKVSPLSSEPVKPQGNTEPQSGSGDRSRMFYSVIPVLAILFLLVNVGLFAYLQITNYQQKNPIALKPTVTPSPSPTPTPTPTPYPLPQGKQAFLMSYGNGTKGPKIGKVTLDPYDPKIGQSQTFTVDATNTDPITSVALSLYTDNKVATYSLERVGGSDISGTWQTKITTNDTHLYHYYPYFTVKSATEQYSTGLTLRAY